MFTIFSRMIFRQLLKSKQLGVSVLIIVFIGLVISFQTAISAYRIVTMDELKGIYPTIFYNRIVKDISHPKGISSQEEIFILALNMDFRYQRNGNTIKLPDIGLRSYANAHVPKILQQENNDQYLHLSQHLFNKLSRSKDFDGQGIYLLSLDDKWHYYQIKSFTNFSDSFWIVLSNQLAHDIFDKSDFSSVTLYGELEMNGLREWYAEQYVVIEYWHERLPLFGRLFHGLLKFLSWIFVMLYLFLLVFLTMLVVSDLSSEYNKLLKTAAFYHYSLYKLILGLCGFIISYSILMSGLGYWIAQWIYFQASHYFPLLLHNTVTVEWAYFLIFIGVEIIMISFFSAYYYSNKDILSSILDD